jgi:hypothetical protein
MFNNYKHYKIDLTSESDIFSGKPYDFAVNFSPPIEVGKKGAEVALSNLNIWNSLKNISVSLGNNQIRYNNGSVWKIVTLQEGTYSIEALNLAIQSGISGNGDTANNIVLVPNYSTLKVDLLILNSYQLDLSFGTINVLLGWDSVIVNASASGQNDANVNLGITNWNISTNILSPDSSYSNGSSSSSLFSFSPNMPAGSLISISPTNLLYLPIGTTVISRINIRITDQLNRTLTQLSDNENTSFTLVLRTMA